MRRLLLLLLVVTAGCDRARLDEVGTDLLVSTPDLSVVQVDPDLRLVLRPPVADGPLFLVLNGAEVPYDSTVQGFVYRTTLDRGLNSFALEITDDAGTVETSTLYAVHLTPQNIPIVGADETIARADAAVELMTDGRAIVTGGTGLNGRVLASATILSPGGSQIRAVDTALLTPRTGHTATAVRGGVLLLGGTGSNDAFVGGAEIIDADGVSRRIDIADDVVIARTGHTTFRIRLNGVTYLYLYGGRVPAGSGTTVSGTVDIFEVEEVGSEAVSRLVRLTPPGGSGSFAPITDHVQVRTGQASAVQFGIGGGGAVSSQFVWTTPGTASFPFSLNTRETAPLATTRSGAASAEVENGLAIIIGGRNGDGDTLGSIELYAPSIDRTFRFPAGFQLLVPRSDHVATILSNGRIVVSGGRSSNGSVVTTLESLQL